MGQAIKMCILYNEKNMAEKFLSILESRALRDGAIFEIYSDDGQPFQNLFYCSEKPFSW
jgi:hypothetical protein